MVSVVSSWYIFFFVFCFYLSIILLPINVPILDIIFPFNDRIRSPRLSSSRLRTKIWTWTETDVWTSALAQGRSRYACVLPTLRSWMRKRCCPGKWCKSYITPGCVFPCRGPSRWALSRKIVRCELRGDNVTIIYNISICVYWFLLYIYIYIFHYLF